MRIYTLYNDADIILPEMLSESIRCYKPIRPQVASSGFGLKKMLEKYEMAIITEALKQYDGNLSRTAEYLDCTRDVLYKKMRRLKLDSRQSKGISLEYKTD